MISAQRRGADPGASVWVSASAGTGKTHVLTDRVLRLLLAGTPPPRILCLTFTNAAAAEMANRIYERLSAWARADGGALRADLELLGDAEPFEEKAALAQRLFAQVLDAPGGLRIETIHAFCDSLLARFPLEAGLPPHFAVTDERTAAELLELAIDEVLGEARDAGRAPLTAALSTISAHVHERAFIDLMTELLAERGRLRQMLDGSLESALGGVQRALGVEADENEAMVVAAACADDGIDTAALARAVQVLAAGSAGDRARSATIAAWLDAPERRAERFADYLRAFFTAEDQRRQRLISRRAAEASPEAEAALAVEAERLGTVVERRKTLTVANATAAVLRVGTALDEAYEGIKRRHARLDYDDLILHASALVRRPSIAPWVLYKLDGGLDHILIDEAQDTNADQWRIIGALADEFFAGHGAREVRRTLFAVGDTKQSIYSFQRADPSQFAGWRSHFQSRVEGAEEIWRPVDLVTSYRSSGPVLGLVDRVFHDAEARDGLLFDEDWLDHESHRKGQAGLVELWPVEEPSAPAEIGRWELPLSRSGGERPAARLARRIADCITDWLQNGELLPSRGRAVVPGDIMILVQRRSQFLEEMVRALKAEEIPVAGTDRMVLSEQIAVMDLMALGRFVLLPEDDLTLAVVLKSPLVGWSEEQLYALAQPRGERTLWQALVAAKDESDHGRAAHAYLSHWLGRADFLPPYEFYAEVLGAGGGRRALLARLGEQANEPIDEFLARALEYERSGVPSLQGFLHWLKAGRAEVKRDLEHGRNEVRVMTVHGAKGLQAPIVFLPDTCRVPNQDERLLWLGEAGPVVWPVCREYEDELCRSARAAARHRRDQEYRRLLYVALTRAEDRLYIAGWETRNRRRDHCWYNLLRRGLEPIADPFETAHGRIGLRLESPQEEPPDRATGATDTALEEPAMPRWLHQPAPPEASPGPRLVPSRPKGEEPPVRAPTGGDDDPARRRGSLVHRLLQTLPDLPADERDAAATRFLANPAWRLTPKAQTEVAAETLAILEEGTLAPLFGPGSRAEVTVIGTVGESVISGRVDRLAIGDREVLIVDYKTNRPAPADESAVSPTYLGQMAAYRALLAEIYPAKTIRCALVWTEGPRLMELSDARLDSCAP